MEMLLESVAWIALGFVPTLAFLEMSWRMGKVIGKRRMTGTLQQTRITAKKEEPLKKTLNLDEEQPFRIGLTIAKLLTSL
jgi:hypothetical protein